MNTNIPTYISRAVIVTKVLYAGNMGNNQDKDSVESLNVSDPLKQGREKQKKTFRHFILSLFVAGAIALLAVTLFYSSTYRICSAKTDTRNLCWTQREAEQQVGPWIACSKIPAEWKWYYDGDKDYNDLCRPPASENILVASSTLQSLVSTIFWASGFICLIIGGFKLIRAFSFEKARTKLRKQSLIYLALGIFLFILPFIYQWIFEYERAIHAKNFPVHPSSYPVTR